jgi:transcriptional regulator with XRE-family HTH domain
MLDMARVTPLKIEIVKSGLKTYEVAEAVGVDPTVVSRWANGGRIPKIHEAQALARALNTTVDVLFPVEPTATT